MFQFSGEGFNYLFVGFLCLDKHAKISWIYHIVLSSLGVICFFLAFVFYKNEGSNFKETYEGLTKGGDAKATLAKAKLGA